MSMDDVDTADYYDVVCVLRLLHIYRQRHQLLLETKMLFVLFLKVERVLYFWRDERPCHCFILGARRTTLAHF